MNFDPARGRSVTNRLILGIRKYVEGLPLDWDRLARAAGLDPQVELDAEGMTSVGVALALLGILSRETQNDAIGFELGFNAPIGAKGLFDYMAISAPSLRVALQNWARFHEIPTNAVALRFEETRRCGRLSWEIPDYLGPRSQLIGMVVGYTVSRLRYMTGDDAAQPTVEFSFVAPRCVASFEAVIGRNLRFGQLQDSVSVPLAWLDAVPPGHDPTLFSLLEQMAVRELKEREAAQDQLFPIAELMTRRLSEGGVSLDHVAAGLAMSPRSLQRVLEANGTSFREVSDRVRREVAMRYLTESDMTIKEIAAHTGFSEQSAFARAVRGWFGASPNEIRSRARGRR